MKYIWTLFKNEIDTIWCNIKEKSIYMFNIIKKWVMNNLFFILNYFVIISAYLICYGKCVYAETILGLWIFISIVYKMYKLYTKK